jgi:hypothetical protein
MSEEPPSSRHRVHDPEPLETVWEQHAPEWIAWARTPGHDSY